MKVILTIKPHGKTITEILTVLSLVVPQLEAVGVVAFDTQDDNAAITQPLPQSPEVLPDPPEALDQERERLKVMSKTPPPPSILTPQEEAVMLAGLNEDQRREYELAKPAGVQTGGDFRSKKKRVVG